MPDRFTLGWVSGGIGRRPEASPDVQVERHWVVPAEAVAAVLATDPVAGLTATEAADRLQRFGPNELVERGRKPPGRLLAAQFANTMILVLVAAGLVTAVIGDLKDTIVIVAIVVLNAVVGFVQEYRAEQAMAALKAMAAPSVQVVRDGHVRLPPAAALVPGNVVLLAQGDVLAADVRLVEAAALRVNEAALTGESEPATKATERTFCSWIRSERPWQLVQPTTRSRNGPRSWRRLTTTRRSPARRISDGSGAVIA
jgi:Ca2+-transporting ATPase